MAINNLPGVLKTLKTEEILLHCKLTGAGAAALTESDPYAMGSIVASVSRTSMGIFAITFTHKVPQTALVLEPMLVSAVATVGRKARWTALDLAAGTGTLRIETESASAIPAWSGATAVAGHTVTLTTAGMITAVDLTAGGVTGGGHLMSAAPAVTREVQVEYDAAGVPTLNFLAGDAVTETKYQQIPFQTVVDPESTDSIYIGFIARNHASH